MPALATADQLVGAPRQLWACNGAAAQAPQRQLCLDVVGRSGETGLAIPDDPLLLHRGHALRGVDQRLHRGLRRRPRVSGRSGVVVGLHQSEHRLRARAVGDVDAQPPPDEPPIQLRDLVPHVVRPLRRVHCLVDGLRARKIDPSHEAAVVRRVDPAPGRSATWALRSALGHFARPARVARFGLTSRGLARLVASLSVLQLSPRELASAGNTKGLVDPLLHRPQT
mmetsp:Transcript_68882/g.190683  ORF Transcript_68882/g.190683 Transcript_68882/m.190683 type:complete len:225 (+) Transcript_68882:242-916(+)